MPSINVPTLRMKIPVGTNSRIAIRAEALLQQYRERQYRRTDRLFAALMAFQWLACVCAACWLTPRTWEGLSTRMHPHIWAAAFLGGAISLFPILLSLRYPGRAVTRHVIAAGQLLMSGLLIHLTGGRIETHFHIFGSLAFLAFYRDWRVLLTASLVTATDHIVRGYFFPESIYGVPFIEPGRWLEHIGWVLFTDTFLIISIIQSVQAMKGTALRQAQQEEAEAELQGARNSLEQRVRERTEALHESEQRLRLALESSCLGVYRIDLDADSPSEISDICLTHFGLTQEEDISADDFFRAIHPEDRDRLLQAFQRAIIERDDYEAEFRYHSPDGRIHWTYVHGRPSYSEEDGVPHMIGVTQDITERKAAEAEREEALRDALDRANLDPLTGLWNHRAFHKRFEEEAARAEREGGPLAVVVMDLDNFKFFNDCYGHTVGDEVLRMMTQRLLSVCRSYDTVARFGGDEFALLLPQNSQTTAAEVEARIASDLSGLSFLPDGQSVAIPITVSVGAALLTQFSQDRQEVLRQADERLLRAKTGGANEAEAQQVRAAFLRRVQGFSMLDALVTAVDNKDRYTRKHSEDVMAYSVIIARELGMDETTQYTVAVAALLHDVGKIGVPDEILRKPGRLTDEEFEAVKQHPMMGAIMVGAVPGLEETLDAVRHHHERWDGKGYPFGLKGEECPLMARLMAVADAFSAMTTDRPYRKGMNKEKALAILRAGAGTQWDEKCVETFLQAQKDAQKAEGVNAEFVPDSLDQSEAVRAEAGVCSR